MHIIAIFIGCINLYFAFKCVEIANKKNRSNNFWVVMALLFGIFAYFVIVYIVPERKQSS